MSVSPMSLLRSAVLIACVILSACALGSGGGGKGPAAVDRTGAAQASASERDLLRRQIEANWNLDSVRHSDKLGGMELVTKIDLLPNGTVTGIKIENNQSGSAIYQKVAATLVQAIEASSPLSMPPGEAIGYVRIVFRPDQVSQKGKSVRAP